MHTEDTVEAALKDYKAGVMTTKDIGEKYKVSPGTLTAWARKEGIPLRQQGRRKMDEPTEQQKEILTLIQFCKLTEVASRFRMEKQQVHRLGKRWEEWRKKNVSTEPPFKPGDVILHAGEKLTVVKVGRTSGVVVNKNGMFIRDFPWAIKGYLHKKVGFRKKYAEPDLAVA